MEIPEIRDIDIAFGGDMKKILPTEGEIPKEYWDGHTDWNKFVSTWFFFGIKKDCVLVPREGVDASKAMRHVKAIMGSFEPKHEHKEAACAYLMNKYFAECPKYESNKSV